MKTEIECCEECKNRNYHFEGAMPSKCFHSCHGYVHCERCHSESINRKGKTGHCSSPDCPYSLENYYENLSIK